METVCGRREKGQKTDSGWEEETGEKMGTNDDKRRGGHLGETVGNPQFDLNSHVPLPAQTRETGPLPEKFLHLVFLDMPPRPAPIWLCKSSVFVPAAPDLRNIRPPAPAASPPSLYSARSTLPARMPATPLVSRVPAMRVYSNHCHQTSPHAACFAFHIRTTRRHALPKRPLFCPSWSKAFRFRFLNHAPNQHIDTSTIPARSAPHRQAIHAREHLSPSFSRHPHVLDGLFISNRTVSEMARVCLATSGPDATQLAVSRPSLVGVSPELATLTRFVCTDRNEKQNRLRYCALTGEQTGRRVSGIKRFPGITSAKLLLSGQPGGDHLFLQTPPSTPMDTRCNVNLPPVYSRVPPNQDAVGFIDIIDLRPPLCLRRA